MPHLCKPIGAFADTSDNSMSVVLDCHRLKWWLLCLIIDVILTIRTNSAYQTVCNDNLAAKIKAMNEIVTGKETSKMMRFSHCYEPLLLYRNRSTATVQRRAGYA